ncbi:unnamed protein product [Echinostoma caproni]|uniref:Protein kinase domain-containing protein n=1 Tax=Echinostoma caproni TaxID=27848 RepID=A0A183A4X1_9TREM|nr:unnamed protein product [Echinostoma caproni]
MATNTNPDYLGPTYVGRMRKALDRRQPSLAVPNIAPLSVQWAKHVVTGMDLSQTTVASSPGPSPHKEQQADDREPHQGHSPRADQWSVFLQTIEPQRARFGRTVHQLSVFDEPLSCTGFQSFRSWMRRRRDRAICEQREQLLRSTVQRNMKLIHPVIIPTYGVVFINRRPTIVSQWISGGSLATILDQAMQTMIACGENNCAPSDHGAVITLASCISFLVDIARGLEYLHEQQIFYQTLTTKDIFLARGNRCRLRVPLLTAKPIALDMYGQMPIDYGTSTAVFANHLQPASCDVPINLSVPGTIGLTNEPAETRQRTEVSHYSGRERLEKFVDCWSSVTVPKTKLGTPYFSNLLIVQETIIHHLNILFEFYQMQDPSLISRGRLFYGTVFRVNFFCSNDNPPASTQAHHQSITGLNSAQPKATTVQSSQHKTNRFQMSRISCAMLYNFKHLMYPAGKVVY